MKSRITKVNYRFEIQFDNKYYYKNNIYHRDKDLPAVIWEDGTRVWFKNGKSHRDNDKPSLIYPDGKMEWWENGNFIERNF